jgi:putative ABC transport system permease protein
MPLIRHLNKRAQTLAGRRRFESDLEDEMKFHLDMETEKNMEKGMSPEEARARAERDFGRVDLHKDQVRDARGVTWLDDLRRDVRFGLRSLRRSPGFTIVAVLCLALGIGANAALFSVLNAVLLRPMPYPEPDRLVRIYETMEAFGEGSVSGPNYRDWVVQATGFESLAAWVRGSRNLLHGGNAERIRTVEATPNLFRMLHAQRPLRGRFFTPGTDDPNRDKVAVLSESFWRRRFAADPGLVGKTIQLDGTFYTVIGIMPESFAFPPLAREPAEAWLLYVDPPYGNSRGAHFLTVNARLKPGVSLEQATAQLKQVAARIEKTFPDEQTGRSVKVTPLRESIVGKRRPALMILLGAVFLVLLIACANVANLLLARAAVRQREVAVRLALGAGRARLIRQFLVESLVLALAGAFLGLLLAFVGMKALTPLVQVALPVAGGIPLDGRVFLFLLGVAVFSGIAFGLVPALQAARGDVRETLVDGGSGRTTAGGRQQRFRSGLVIAEIALSLVLLVGAGLLLRGFLKVSGTEPGFVSKGVITGHLSVPAVKGETVPRFFRPLLERVRSLPGVRSAALISMLPVQEAYTNASYTVVGRPEPPLNQQPMAEMRVVSPGFFATLGIPVLRGRDFQEREGEQKITTAVVNEVLTRKQFPGEDPIGRRIHMSGMDLEIVGVIGAIHQAGLDVEPLEEVYLPYAGIRDEYADILSNVALVVKTNGAPGALTGDLRRTVHAADPGVPLHQVQTMDEVVSESLASRRLNLWLLAIFAGIALALSAAGLYGVISYLVAQRTREIGMRMALGAQARDVIALVMRQGSRLTALGILVGVIGAFALTRWLESMLDGVSARDPITFLSITGLLALVALLATFIPASRAARVNPILAIRRD